MEIVTSVFNDEIVIVTGKPGDKTILRTPQLGVAQALATARNNLARTNPLVCSDNNEKTKPVMPKVSLVRSNN
ncbi:MAG: hypothetical protein QY322_02565 [bacterium]|nr:MAG: hypothetical protein QY322_02565 [bacterium]